MGAVCRQDAVDELIRVARDFGARGWTPATSGNYSIRCTDGTLLITRSGVDKRGSRHADLMRLDPRGRAGRRRAVGRGAAACPALRARPGYPGRAARTLAGGNRGFAASVGRRFDKPGKLRTAQGPGRHGQPRRCGGAADVPNDQDMRSLAATVRALAGASRHPPAYLIEGHGIYAWGRSCRRCRAPSRGAGFRPQLRTSGETMSQLRVFADDNPEAVLLETDEYAGSPVSWTMSGSGSSAGRRMPGLSRETPRTGSWMPTPPTSKGSGARTATGPWTW